MGELFELSERAEIVQFVVTILFAVMVVIIWGPKTLAKQSKVDGHKFQYTIEREKT